jgi:hypothetical protein
MFRFCDTLVVLFSIITTSIAYPHSYFDPYYSLLMPYRLGLCVLRRTYREDYETLFHVVILSKHHYHLKRLHANPYFYPYYTIARYGKLDNGDRDQAVATLTGDRDQAVATLTGDRDQAVATLTAGSNGLDCLVLTGIYTYLYKYLSRYEY